MLLSRGDGFFDVMVNSIPQKYVTGETTVTELKCWPRGECLEGSSMDLGQSHLFISNSKTVRKHLRKATARAKARPASISDITSHIVNAYESDRHIQQNLIIAVERLAHYDNDTSSAANLCIASIKATRAIFNKLAALNIAYSITEEAFDEKVYRIMIRYHEALEQPKAALTLLQCMPSSQWTEQKEEVLQSMSTADLVVTRSEIIFNQFSKAHMDRVTSDIDSTSDPVTQQRQSHSPLLDIPMAVWCYGTLLYRMVSRDIRLKYQKSILGWLWAIIEPLALTLTFLFLFEVLLAPPEQYRPLNILVGIMVWGSFSYIMLRGTRFLEDNIGTIQRVSLPRQIFLLNISGTAMTTLGLNLIAVIPLLVYYELVPTIRFLYLPLSMFLITLYAIGITLFTSTMQTKWRDVSHVVVVAIRIGFYFTPVFFTLDTLIGSRIPSEYIATYLLINPMAIFLTMARSAFTGQPLGVDNYLLLAGVIQAVALFILGSYWFRKKQDLAVKYL